MAKTESRLIPGKDGRPKWLPWQKPHARTGEKYQKPDRSLFHDSFLHFRPDLANNEAKGLLDHSRIAAIAPADEHGDAPLHDTSPFPPSLAPDRDPFFLTDPWNLSG
ncbi:hypothetical protein CDL15_Pgr028831 [Punica granatum]|uniref:Uncharacterized protein n=1 Tax=Punica granatum TaxID=22663 RepID=A0A218WWQ6_PUNGR|nr:hypothetical protein CDL15_Pgr028831 [Punica granatum]